MKSWFRCFCIAFLALLLLPGCKKNEFKISLSFPKEVNSTYRMLYYASDSKKGWLVETAVDVRNGKGEIKCATHHPTLIFIFKGSKQQPATFFYAERGDKVEITGKDSDPATWTISGNKINERLSAWISANASKLNNAKSCNQAVSAYIKEHNDDPVSALLLMTFYDRRADEQGFLKLQSSLKGDAANSKWVDLVSRADLISGSPETAKCPKELIFSTKYGRDTVKTTGKPMLLLFTRTGNTDHDRMIKSLRKLSREWPDSDARIIVDYNIDTDSMARFRPLNYDSIKGVIRAWVPLGFSDPKTVALGVAAIPSARVSDAKGKVIYAGDDQEEAIKKFKELKGEN